MAAIIERDYFPDVKRMQNKLEWMAASESGDPDQLSNTQRNIILRRAGYSVRPRPRSRHLPLTSGIVLCSCAETRD